MLVARLLAGGLAFLAMSCGEPALPDSDALLLLDACRPTTVVAAPDTTAAERDGIRAALGLWRAALGPPLLLHDPAVGEPTTESAQTLSVGFERAAPLFYGVFRPERGDILINRALSDPGARAITIAHELGHAFGLAHIQDRPSLMNAGNLVIPPGDHEVRLIHEQRGPCEAPR